MEGSVVEELWMPLKTQTKGVLGVLDDLDDSVWCSTRDPKSARLVDCLMMRRVDLDLSSSDQPREPSHL